MNVASWVSMQVFSPISSPCFRIKTVYNYGHGRFVCRYILSTRLCTCSGFHDYAHVQTITKRYFYKLFTSFNGTQECDFTSWPRPNCNQLYIKQYTVEYQLSHKSDHGWRKERIRHGYRQSHWVRLTVTVSILFCSRWEYASAVCSLQRWQPTMTDGWLKLFFEICGLFKKGLLSRLWYICFTLCDS
jgi:hypothetical protein